MSVTFSSGFHLIKPGVRISGDQITSVIKGVYDSGLYSGQKFIHIDLAEEQDLTYVEEGVAGPSETVADVDALYDQLKAAGMIELFDGMLIDISDVSIISVSGTEVKFDFRGHQPYIFDRNPDPAATEIQKLANQTWLLPQVTFDASAATLSAADGSEEIEFVSIENRLGLLEATNGLIKQDYNYITLVGTPAPDPGQVGVDSATPSQVTMIVLPKEDADGKTLTYDQFVLGDRMGLKQSNGSAALYELDPALDTGDHIRFNATLLTLGYYEDQDFVFNTAVTAVIEDNSSRTSAAGVMGVLEADSDLGTFSGTTIADGSSIKAALQALETSGETLEQRIEDLIATDMWLFPDQASFPSAADNHGRVVHSHADGAIFYAHGGMWHQVAKEVDLQSTIASLASEASIREAADTALDGRVTVLEADPTTATAVAAGDAATLSSANTYTDTSITNLVNGADAALDTLKEIGDALAQGDTDVTAALTAQITTESTTRAAADTALSGRLDVLEADPTTATALAAVQADVDSNEADGDAADAALSGRLDTLEADPTTATAVAAVQADVDQNESDSDAADAALSARLDVLEADPTTATALAAVQGDVDQNEADGDAADAALSGRLDVLEADPTTATAVAAVQSDVDQNEADSDAADAALSGRLDVLEADPTTATAVAAVQSDVDQNEADADAALALRALLDGTNIPGIYNNDTEAAAGGVAVGAIYKNSNGTIHFRVS